MTSLPKTSNSSTVKAFLSIWLEALTVSVADKKTICRWNSKKQQKFFQPLKFGTGFRGPLQLGSNCFNRYTIKIIALALVNIWKKTFSPSKLPIKILIFRDHRHQSREMSELFATVLQSFGIHVYFFANNSPVPTPFLSFVLTNSQQFDGGIMITASHSPKNINGVKLFDRFGYPWNETANLQINQLLEKNYAQFLNHSLSSARHHFQEIDKSWKTKYFQTLLQSSKITSTTASPKEPLKIVFSSLHGVTTGWTDVLLKKVNYSVFTVPQQAKMDPDFPTIVQPNPEEDATFVLAQQVAIAQQVNLIILNDGDGDRMRAAWYQNNVWHLLSGNDIAVIFTYFFLKEEKRQGKIIHSLVSTPIVEKIAQDFYSSVVKTATGFGNLADTYQNIAKQHFILAFEESIGFLLDLTINRDKDGLQGALLLAKIATFCLRKQTNLFDYLQAIYRQYGFCYINTYSFASTNNYFAKRFVTLQPDQKWEHFVLKKKEVFFLNSSTISSVFFLFFNHHCHLAIRQSQTEPITKIYLFVLSNVLSMDYLQKLTKQLISLCQETFNFPISVSNRLK